MVSGFFDFIGELFFLIYYDMFKMGQVYEECVGMGVMFSFCWFMLQWMYFGYIGDSCIYYFLKGGMFI